MEPADAAGAGLRVRPAGVRRPVRRLAGRRGQGRPSWWRRRAHEIDRVQAMGGAVAAVESGYLKSELVGARTRGTGPGSSPARTSWSASTGSSTTEPSPLTADLDDRRAGGRPGGRGVRGESRCGVAGLAGRRPRRAQRRRRALAQLRADAATTDNLMPATLRCARAGVTTGEWAGVLREVFGEYRAPTGVSRRGRHPPCTARPRTSWPGCGPRSGDRRGARRPAAAARRQARAGRAQQRRRAGRRPGPRRRLRGDLPGHPAHARADRRGCRGRGRALRRAVGAVRLAPVALVPGRAAAGCARPGWTTCRSWSAGSSPRVDARWLRRAGGRGRLHAEGLRR